jgi:hypothetical protein
MLWQPPRWILVLSSLLGHRPVLARHCDSASATLASGMEMLIGGLMLLAAAH